MGIPGIPLIFRIGQQTAKIIGFDILSKAAELPFSKDAYRRPIFSEISSHPKLKGRGLWNSPAGCSA
jgi:hypothetical protein